MSDNSGIFNSTAKGLVANIVSLGLMDADYDVDCMSNALLKFRYRIERLGIIIAATNISYEVKRDMANDLSKEIYYAYSNFISIKN